MTTIMPVGKRITVDSIEAAGYNADMVTFEVTDEGRLHVRPFKLDDIGDDEAQYRWLYEEVLLNECAVKPFTDWDHLERAGKCRYPNGTGYGWQYLSSVLAKNGVIDPLPILQRMLAEGLVIELGYFNASVGSGFTMYAAKPKED